MGSMLFVCCFQYVKDNRLKANHNKTVGGKVTKEVVFSMSKIID